MNTNDIEKAEKILIKIKSDHNRLIKLVDSSKNITRPMKVYIRSEVKAIVIAKRKTL